MNPRPNPHLHLSNVLITGASGFIGARLVDRLADQNRSDKHHLEVKALIRHNTMRRSSNLKPDRNGRCFNSGIEFYMGDLTDKASLRFEQDSQFDVIFHLAALTPEGRQSQEILQRVNVDGTKNLFDAVCDRTRHFIYVSGVSVFETNNQNERVVNEESPKNSNIGYIRTRLETEDYLRENCRSKGIDLTVIHLPEIVYGNGGTFRTIFLEQIEAGKFRIPGKGEYVINFVHLDDAVDILITIAARRHETANQSYIASDSHPAPFRDFVNFIADQFEVKHPGTVPLILARAAVGSDLIKMLTRNIKASNEKIRRIYDFQFPSYEVGIPNIISEFNST